MKLRRLRVRRMPGIEDGFTLSDVPDGPILVVGPNGSGKTTMCRAFRAALWPSTETGQAIAVEVHLDDGSRRWIVRRDASHVRWQQDGEETDPPALPSPNAAHCFTLGFRDLLSTGDPTDQTVAQEMRKQMAGGYDVLQVLESEFRLRRRHGFSEDEALRRCNRKVGQIKAEQSDLAEREERLRELDEELRDARSAAVRLESLKTAAELRRTRDELDSIRRRLREFPDGVASLTGDERRRIDELDEEEERLVDELTRCRAEIRDAEDIADEARLPDGPVDEAVLSSWTARLARLHKCSNDLVTARRMAQETRARLDEAERDLDPERSGEVAPVIDRETLREVESFLERAVTIGTERRRLDADRRALSSPSPERSSRDLDRGMRRLWAWKTAHAGRPAKSLRYGLSGLALTLLLAAPVSWWFGERSAALALAAAGIATTTLWLTTVGAGRHDAAAEVSRKEFEQLGLEPPASWETDAVVERLGELQREFAEALDRERSLQRIDELDKVDTILREREQNLAEERSALRQRIGLDPAVGDLDLARVARALWAHREASIEHRRAQASWEYAERERAKLLEEIGAFVTRHGLAAPTDEADATAAVETLKDRSRKLRQALKLRQREQERFEDTERRIAQLRGRRDAIFTHVGLEPSDERRLGEWLERREDFVALDDDAKQLRRTVGDLERRLADRPELGDLPPAEIERRIFEATALADRQESLIEERTRTREEVRRARRGKALEEATARATAAKDALEARLDEAVFKKAGQFLLDDVTAEFDRHSRPEVLNLAVELFERFTHHRYELKIDAGPDQVGFRAVETETGTGKSLSELSDATRVQLLLAARMAFASHVDRDARLPLFLDEVLTTTDPERFVAVAESLLMLARETGRQVIYLTANPGDVVQWNRVLQAKGLEQAVPIDLAALRGLKFEVGGSGELELPPPPVVPSPSGMSAEHFGALLKVPRVDPNRPVTALHLFHLLRDELDLLYRLLVSRIETVGQWRTLAAAGGGASLVGQDAAARISALTDAAEAFFDAWRIGRSRPMDTANLREAGLSEIWVDKLESLLEELDGDPARLLDALDERIDERTKGFRTRVLERFREYLVRHGFIDERDPLGDAGIHSRVQIAVAVHVRNGLLRREDVARIVHELHHQGGVRA